MKAVIKSVSTEIFENIISRKRSVLNSKTTPNCEPPFKVYVYCNKAKNQWRFSDYEGAYENSKGEIICAQQRVAAEFVCDSTANGWHISDLKIYNTPKKLSEFRRPCSYKGLCHKCKRFRANGPLSDIFCNSELNHPPKGWCYVKDLEEVK